MRLPATAVDTTSNRERGLVSQIRAQACRYVSRPRQLRSGRIGWVTSTSGCQHETSASRSLSSCAFRYRRRTVLASSLGIVSVLSVWHQASGLVTVVGCRERAGRIAAHTLELRGSRTRRREGSTSANTIRTTLRLVKVPFPSLGQFQLVGDLRPKSRPN